MPVFPMRKLPSCRLPRGRFRELVGQVEEKPIYVTGRPKADGTRKIHRTTYRLKISLRPREQAVARARKEAGCFVLITNEPRKPREDSAQRSFSMPIRTNIPWNRTLGSSRTP